MAPRWSESSRRHHVARHDAIHAILNATYVAREVEPRPVGRVVLFIGPPHAQSLPTDEIEVLVHEFPETGQEAAIFHVMPLGPKWRRYREENPHG